MKPLLTLLVCLLFIPAARAQDDEFRVKLLPITADIEMSAAKALHRCDPVPGKIVGEINKNNIYTLTGDIFNNGRIYSAIDDNTDVIICEWKAPDWNPIAVINVGTVWNFPTNYREQTGRTPFSEPVPFWIIDFHNRPLLVIASYVEKAGQNYYVLLFNSNCTKILNTTASFASSPEGKLGYLLTGSCPRGRAEIGETTYFSKIQNNTFIMLNSWTDCIVRNIGPDEVDDSCNIARSNGVRYFIYEDPNDTNTSINYQISKDDPINKEVAKIQFTSKGTLGPNDGLEYIFEKLTGLPRELYPDFDAASPEMKWDVRVTGDDPALIKLLSTK